MLLEIGLCVAEVALCLDRQHAEFLAHPSCRTCNEFITTRVGNMRFNGRMSVKLKHCFSWHAVRLSKLRWLARQPLAATQTRQYSPADKDQKSVRHTLDNAWTS